MTTLPKYLVGGALLVALLGAEVSPRSTLPLRWMPEALAVVGAPLTPASYAGVARRTTRRTVAVAGSVAAAEQADAEKAAAAQQSATAQQQSATAQQQSATAQQQSATAQQQAAAAQPKSAAPPAAAGQALPIGTVVTALPPGCTQTQVGGVQYSHCGADYYRAAFQGSNLVYVTAQP
jgi:cobalamin biosynthesis Mg chelatase CobN